jgi:hypothetical protein
MASDSEPIGRGIRTGLVVVVITLLIWIAADQWVTVVQEFSVTIQPVSTSRDRYIALTEPPYQRTIKIELRGRRSRIDTFRSRYEAPAGEVIRIPIDDIGPERMEPYELAAKSELLRYVPDIRLTGVVVSTDPEKLSVRINRFVEVADIPIRFEYGDLRVRDKPSARKVTARLPEFIVKDERFQADRHAVVNAVPLISDRTPGRNFEYEGEVSLELDADLPADTVTLTPDVVRVTGQIETLESVVNMGPITVKWSVPDSVQRDFVIVADKSSEFVGVHLDVRGPKDRVAQLDPSKIRAFVEIFAADRTNTDPGKKIVRDVVFMLPPNFSDCTLSNTSGPTQVEFHLEPRGIANGSTDDTKSGGA